MLLKFALILLLANVARSEQWTGLVVGIHDGDTITVLHGKTQVKIRLDGIDCPEKAQPYGTRAERKTAELAADHTVTVVTTKTDRYGRTLAVVKLPNGHILNDELVKAGLAWWYRKYAPKNHALERMEENARDAHLGLWADPDPVPPWLWRKENGRKEKKILAGASR